MTRVSPLLRCIDTFTTVDLYEQIKGFLVEGTDKKFHFRDCDLTTAIVLLEISAKLGLEFRYNTKSESAPRATVVNPSSARSAARRHKDETMGTRSNSSDAPGPLQMLPPASHQQPSFRTVIHELKDGISKTASNFADRGDHGSDRNKHRKLALRPEPAAKRQTLQSPRPITADSWSCVNSLSNVS